MKNLGFGQKIWETYQIFGAHKIYQNMTYSSSTRIKFQDVEDILSIIYK